MSALVSRQKIDESLESHGIVVLLIDDQPIIGEAVRRMLAEERDIQFHYCSDPNEAVQKAIEIKPTVILQDLVMPDIEGLELVKYFRATPNTKDIPLIVLSVKEEPTVKAEAFSLGANDYLVKLPDKVELVARIRYHSQAYINFLERNEAYARLMMSQQQLNDELSEAAEYVKSLLPAPIDDDIKSEWKFITSTKLGGDSFGYHWLSDDHFAIYLLDVCGHGVGAALLSISVMNVLRSQSLNTNFYDPSQVLLALNETFPMEQQNNMFFTIWYGVYNKSNRQLIYSSGGHPPAIVFNGRDQSSATMSQLTTPGFVIGGVPNVTFENSTFTFDKFANLYVFSDGVYEIVRSNDGTMWTFEEFSKMLEEKPNLSVDQILKEVSKISGSNEFDDDFSIMRLLF